MWCAVLTWNSWWTEGLPKCCKNTTKHIEFWRTAFPSCPQSCPHRSQAAFLPAVTILQKYVPRIHPSLVRPRSCPRSGSSLGPLRTVPLGPRTATCRSRVHAEPLNRGQVDLPFHRMHDLSAATNNSGRAWKPVLTQGRKALAGGLFSLHDLSIQWRAVRGQLRLGRVLVSGFHPRTGPPPTVESG